MNTQLVRVEHTDGWGMFRSTYTERGEYVRRNISEIDGLSACYERHGGFNTPSNDGLIDFDDSYFCGYQSIEQLQKWIMSEEFELLFKNDFTIYLIEVSKCHIGRDQIIFKKEDVVSKTNINQLFMKNNS